MPAQPWARGGGSRRRRGRAAGGRGSRAWLPGRICLALRTLPPDLIADLCAIRKTPLKKAVFLPSVCEVTQTKRDGKIPPLCFSSHQLRKQRRPNGPECHPGGQLYI